MKKTVNLLISDLIQAYVNFTGQYPFKALFVESLIEQTVQDS